MTGQSNVLSQGAFESLQLSDNCRTEYSGGPYMRVPALRPFKVKRINELELTVAAIDVSNPTSSEIHNCVV